MISVLIWSQILNRVIKSEQSYLADGEKRGGLAGKFIGAAADTWRSATRKEKI